MSGTGRSAELRIGDAEREAAVSVLGDHYAAGRITLAEFDQRSSAAYTARTNAELWPLFRDLPDLRPGPGMTVRGRSRGVTALPGPRARGWPGLPFVPVLLVVVALVALVQVPWPFLLLVGWLFWGRMFRHWRAYSMGNRRAVRGSWS